MCSTHARLLPIWCLALQPQVHHFLLLHIHRVLNDLYSSHEYPPPPPPFPLSFHSHTVLLNAFFLSRPKIDKQISELINTQPTCQCHHPVPHTHYFPVAVSATGSQQVCLFKRWHFNWCKGSKQVTVTNFSHSRISWFVAIIFHHHFASFLCKQSELTLVWQTCFIVNSFHKETCFINCFYK